MNKPLRGEKGDFLFAYDATVSFQVQFCLTIILFVRTILAKIKAPIIKLSFLIKEMAKQRIPQTKSVVIKIFRREKRSEITPPKGLTRMDVTSSEIW